MIWHKKLYEHILEDPWLRQHIHLHAHTSSHAHTQPKSALFKGTVPPEHIYNTRLHCGRTFGPWFTRASLSWTSCLASSEPISAEITAIGGAHLHPRTCLHLPQPGLQGGRRYVCIYHPPPPAARGGNWNPEGCWIKSQPRGHKLFSTQ